MNKIFAGLSAAVALTFGLAGAANATVYTLVNQACCGASGTSFGTVNVTGQGTTTLNVTVNLGSASGSQAYQQTYLNFAGNSFQSFAFDLAGNPTVSYSNLAPAGFSGVPSNTNVVAGDYKMDGAGDYTYAVNYSGISNNGGLPGDGIQTFSFTVTSASALTLTPVSGGNGTSYVAVDIATISPDGKTVSTGVVGGVVAVPEPATWSLMILSVGMIGFAMRRRYKAAAAFA